MRYLCIPDYFDDTFEFIVEIKEYIGIKSVVYDAMFVLMILFISFITLLVSPIVYSYFWNELFHERQRKSETIKYIENDYIKFKNKAFVASPNLKLEELWRLHGPDVNRFSIDECLRLLKTWIDILVINNKIKIDDLKKRIDEIASRRVQISINMCAQQSHILFIPVITTLVMQLSEELVLDT